MALFGTSVLILLGFIYWATAGFMAHQTDQAIAAEITGLAEQYRRRGTPGLVSVIRDRIARDPGGSSLYLLAGPDYQPLVGNLDRWPRNPEVADGWLNFRLDDGAGPPKPARARPFRLRDGNFLLVGRDVRERQQIQNLITRALGWGLAITAALALAGGTMMSWSTIRRIEAINQTSREIMTGDLSRRIPTKGTGDDFDQLADGLNGMLDQIQVLMQGVRQVSDNIAHDLRTPLTRLRARLEQARDGDLAIAAQRTLIESTIAEADGLLATFNALLRIARIEAGEGRAAFADVDLARLLTDAVELYEPAAEAREQHITLAAGAPVSVRGDRDLLFQAVVNLLDNAIKYTPTGGTIDVSLAAAPDGGCITIADSGPGIPPEARQRVIERFVRLEESRATPGNGLGLSLVAAVAALHGATLALEDNAPGLRTILTLPATRPA
jgi:signal transduction histidine kinase